MSMAGPPVSIGCAVLVSPGAAGPPDSGVITTVLQTAVTAGGLPLATTGSICQMVNSVEGVALPAPDRLRRRVDRGQGRGPGARAARRPDPLRPRRADDPRPAGGAVRHATGTAP